MRKKILLSLALFVVSLGIHAKPISVILGVSMIITKPDCYMYHVGIFEDGDDNDPTNDRLIATTVILSDGCGGEPWDDDDVVEVLNYNETATITSQTTENGCDIYNVSIYDGTTEVATGSINSCTHGSSAKMERPTQTSELKVFPTFVNDYLMIEGLKSTNSEISIFDQSGKLVQKSRIEGTQGNIDFSSFPSGIYFLNIQSSNSNFKIFKK